MTTLATYNFISVLRRERAVFRQISFLSQNLQIWY